MMMKTSLSKTDSKKVAKSKTLALQLLQNKQITRKLCRLILEADYTDEIYVRKLMALTEDLLRVKGYYRDEIRVRACDQCIDEWLKNNKQSI